MSEIEASNLSHRLYSVLYNNFNNDQYDFPWLQNVKSILDEVGMSNIRTYQHPQNSIWLSKTVYQKLQDQYRRSTMYQKKTKKKNILAGTGVWKISSIVCGFSSIKN